MATPDFPGVLVISRTTGIDADFSDFRFRYPTASFPTLQKSGSNMQPRLQIQPNRTELTRRKISNPRIKTLKGDMDKTVTL